jgi:hypothetical protein
MPRPAQAYLLARRATASDGYSHERFLLKRAVRTIERRNDHAVPETKAAADEEEEEEEEEDGACANDTFRS